MLIDAMFVRDMDQVYEINDDWLINNAILHLLLQVKLVSQIDLQIVSSIRQFWFWYEMLWCEKMFRAWTWLFTFLGQRSVLVFMNCPRNW